MVDATLVSASWLLAHGAPVRMQRCRNDAMRFRPVANPFRAKEKALDNAVDARQAALFRNHALTCEGLLCRNARNGLDLTREIDARLAERIHNAYHGPDSVTAFLEGSHDG